MTLARDNASTEHRYMDSLFNRAVESLQPIADCRRSPSLLARGWGRWRGSTSLARYGLQPTDYTAFGASFVYQCHRTSFTGLLSIMRARSRSLVPIAARDRDHLPGPMKRQFL